MITLSVTRMSATENTFFVVNGFNPEWSSVLSTWDHSKKVQLAQHLCNQYFGFHTDGLLFLQPHPQHDFTWEFFNSDGSHADMCGNAARCAALFFHERVKKLDQMKFLTGAGPVLGKFISPKEVQIEMPPVSKILPLKVNGNEGTLIHTGVPHFVLELAPSAELARKLRKVADFGPEGANITFVQDLNTNSMKAVTFERGVENFTQACGTGAVAAAVFLQQKKGAQPFVTVQMPGGLLKIEGGQVNQRPKLTGPVQFEFDLSHWS